MGYLAAARKKQRDEFTQQLKASAFTGWQIQNLIGGIFSDKKNPYKGPAFIEYSESLGLLSEEEKQYFKLFKKMEKIRQKAENKRLEQQALEKAANIIQLDKASRQQKGG